ncbi:RNA 2'-phosphotransferase [Methylobrevis albus]|uniref:Probable RNA 2'-phosphotransferase n=1 Tax=Methylobrevis albus TaxID=2793297 RepID=A0A931I2H0_9HYPH|nr:RNA 2'-phosphotransferase [Methylobrevis albus]MBH0238214.1 RNA 2'-phosphotransferase [Methylobrevis albus]
MVAKQSDLTRASRFMALVLRHDPASAGLVLDAEGWTAVTELLRALGQAGHSLTAEDLVALVAADGKGRYAISSDGTRIRANQGHSTADVAIAFAEAEPPARLFHGTVPAALPAILADGLRRMQRHHVHLSGDIETAVKVGARRGRPVVLAVDAAGMRVAGHVFFRSDNGVWLVDAVPPAFLSLTPDTA